MLAETKGAIRVAGGPPDEFGLTFQLASKAALDDPDKAAAVKDALGRIQRAIAWGNENPDEWAKGWSEESKLPLEVTTKTVAEILQDVGPVSDETTKIQQDLSDRLFEDKLIPKQVKFGEIVQPGFIE